MLRLQRSAGAPRPRCAHDSRTTHLWRMAHHRHLGSWNPGPVLRASREHRHETRNEYCRIETLEDLENFLTEWTGWAPWQRSKPLKTAAKIWDRYTAARDAVENHRDSIAQSNSAPGAGGEP